MTNKKVDPMVSEYMSNLAKRNKNPHRFTSETGKKARRVQAEKQRAKKPKD